ncbi:MAG: aspartate beta-hydroxylase, partial [Gammaproteobacteria bacterium]
MDKSKRLPILHKRAQRLSQKGMSEALVKVCRELLALDPSAVDGQRCLAMWHSDREEFVKALPYLRTLRQHAPQMPGLELPLTLALEEAGELDAALELARGLVREDKNNYQPYLYLGSILAALGKHDEAARTYGIAAHLNPQLRDLARRPEGPQFVRKRVAKCVQTLADFGRALHVTAVERARAEFPDASLSRIENAYWRKLHDGAPDTDPGQHPHVFFVPDLARCAWFEREEFPWVEGLEAQMPHILNEVQEQYRGDQDTTPYLKEDAWDASAWNGLVKSKRWAACHFYDGGLRNEDNCSRFPVTASALDDLPLFSVQGAPVEALFSVLEPGTHIPPHQGTANHRLTVHRPLVVPCGCTLTVNGQTRPVASGNAMLFDDTFEHEARNDSDAVRIVLIFEV